MSFILYRMSLGTVLHTFSQSQHFNPSMDRCISSSIQIWSIASPSSFLKATQVSFPNLMLLADRIASGHNTLRSRHVLQNVHRGKSCCGLGSCRRPSRRAEHHWPRCCVGEEAVVYVNRNQRFHIRRLYRSASRWCLHPRTHMEMVLLDVSHLNLLLTCLLSNRLIWQSNTEIFR